MTKDSTEIIAALIGFILIIFGNYKRIQYQKLIVFGIKTEGTVLSLETDDDGILSPIISYSNLKGEIIIKKCDSGSNPSPYKVGDSIILLYDADDNEQFIIDNRQSKFIGPALMFVGSIIVAICLVKYFYNPISLQ